MALRTTNNPDGELVAAVARGEPDAFAQAYAAHKDAILTTASHLLGDAHAAEDVVHDVFVGFARRAGSLRLRGSLRAYLVGAAANRIRDLARRRRATDAGIDRSNGRPAAPALRDAADEAIAGEEAALLQRALTALPPSQREVVVLHLHGGLSFREIAEQSDASINTVQSRYRYGIAQLRARFALQKGKRDELRSRA